MKRIKKIVSLLAAAAVLAIAPGTNVMKAEAATPTTFYVKYDDDKNEWRMQVNEWKDDYEGRELYYLNDGDEKVKDGDIVIVLDNEDDETGSKEIHINAHLSNLTINRAHAVVAVGGGIDECYVFGDSYAAVTGNITNAYVYDNASCTFNSNVTNLHLISTQSNEVEANVTVGGTVTYASLANEGGVFKEYYNFLAGTFHHDYASGLMTATYHYSNDPNVNAYSAPEVPASSVPTPAGSSTSSQGSTASSNEYDDVPKTGESNAVVWLFAISAACFAGSAMMRRKAQ